MAGKGQMRRLAVDVIGTADVDTAPACLSMATAQGHDTTIIGHVAGCRIDSQTVIGQIRRLHLARHHDRTVLAVAGCMERG